MMVSRHGATGERDWSCCLRIWYPWFPCISHPHAPAPTSTSGCDATAAAVAVTGAALGVLVLHGGNWDPQVWGSRGRSLRDEGGAYGCK